MNLKYIWTLWIWVLGASFLQCSSPKLDKGSQAPAFKFKNLEDQAISLDQYKGKVVLIHFWTDWCNSCRVEFPRIQAYYETLKSEDFELIAINVGQPSAVSKTFQEDFEATFPMLADEGGVSKEIYQLEAFPTNYFVDPQGKIIRKIVGWVNKKQIEVILSQFKKSATVANNHR